MAGKKKWYAVYTKPRWEKKVHSLLIEKGLVSYCPLNKVRKQWSDRVKVVEEPLFKSYVFVQVQEVNLLPVRMISGVLNFVYWNGKPAVIKEEEIDTIRKFLNEYEDVEVKPANLQANQAVMVKRGLLMNNTGRIRRLMNNKVEVVIESLGYTLVASLEKNNIIPV
ncbi:MAG TPA: UpxY family transcription antiterminator [Flavobacterium sp.]|nr:UpxY family transcription antiterminator [Flavobacterium sp.]